METGKMTKYFKYAIGEIVLVVIGILIALQINNWNTARLQANKEVNYLKEIKSNLEEDVISINTVLDYNTIKKSTIDSMFILFAETSDPKQYMPKINNYMNALTSYQIFKPLNIAFSNMVSSENIDLISDTELRKTLSFYYNQDFTTGTQERVKEMTRKFGDDLSPLIFNKQLFKLMLNVNSNIQDITNVRIHESEIVYSNLFVMRVNINAQNQLINETKEQIDNLIKLINAHLSL